jgi:hypothetical protein
MAWGKGGQVCVGADEGGMAWAKVWEDVDMWCPLDLVCVLFRYPWVN